MASCRDNVGHIILLLICLGAPGRPAVAKTIPLPPGPNPAGLYEVFCKLVQAEEAELRAPYAL